MQVWLLCAHLTLNMWLQQYPIGSQPFLSPADIISKSFVLSSSNFWMVSVSCLLASTSFSTMSFFATAVIAKLLSEEIIDSDSSSMTAWAQTPKPPPVDFWISHCSLNAWIQVSYRLTVFTYLLWRLGHFCLGQIPCSCFQCRWQGVGMGQFLSQIKVCCIAFILANMAVVIANVISEIPNLDTIYSLIGFFEFFTIHRVNGLGSLVDKNAFHVIKHWEALRACSFSAYSCLHWAAVALGGIAGYADGL